jgi:hypothetical protein
MQRQDYTVYASNRVIKKIKPSTIAALLATFIFTSSTIFTCGELIRAGNSQVLFAEYIVNCSQEELKILKSDYASAEQWSGRRLQTAEGVASEADGIYIDRERAKEKICTFLLPFRAYRGFYLHHYSAFLGALDSEYNKNFSRAAGNQYGYGSRLPASALKALDIKLSVGQFHAIYIAVYALAIGVISAGSLMITRRTSIFTIFLLIQSVLLLAINKDQLVLSPGFTPFRYLPMLVAIMAASIWESGMGTVQNTVHTKKKQLLCLVTGVAIMVNSLTLNGAIVAGATVSLLIRAGIKQYIRKRSNKNRAMSLPDIKASLFLAAAGVSGIAIEVVLAILSGTSISEFGTISRSESIFSKKEFLFWAATLVSLTLTFNPVGINSKLKKHSKHPILGLCYSSLWMSIMTISYTAGFTGSENHLAGMILMSSGYIAIVFSNMIEGRSAFTTPRLSRDKANI